MCPYPWAFAFDSSQRVPPHAWLDRENIFFSTSNPNQVHCTFITPFSGIYPDILDICDLQIIPDCVVSTLYELAAPHENKDGFLDGLRCQYQTWCRETSFLVVKRTHCVCVSTFSFVVMWYRVFRSLKMFQFRGSSSCTMCEEALPVVNDSANCCGIRVYIPKSYERGCSATVPVLHHPRGPRESS